MTTIRVGIDNKMVIIYHNHLLLYNIYRLDHRDIFIFNLEFNFKIQR